MENIKFSWRKLDRYALWQSDIVNGYKTDILFNDGNFLVRMWKLQTYEIIKEKTYKSLSGAKAWANRNCNHGKLER